MKCARHRQKLIKAMVMERIIKIYSSPELAIWHALYAVVLVYACVRVKRHPGPSICIVAAIIVPVTMFFGGIFTGATIPTYVWTILEYIVAIVTWTAVFGWRSDRQRHIHTETASEASTVSKDVLVPRVVRVYGMIIMIFNAIGVGVAVVSALVLLSRFDQYEGPVVPLLLLLYGVVCVGINLIFFRLGRGLRLGERQAVYGLCGLGGLALLVSGAFLAFQPPVGLFLFLVVVMFYMPPVVIAFSHWTAFK
jgi:hypothetical protein